MPLFISSGTVGQGLTRKRRFGLPAWKFWRGDPSTTDLLAAGAAPLRKDMQDQLNQSHDDAWRNENGAQAERQQALDPRLAKMKDEICELLNDSLRIGDGHRSEISSASCLSGRDRSKAGSSALPDPSSATLGASGVADIGRK